MRYLLCSEVVVECRPCDKRGVGTSEYHSMSGGLEVCLGYLGNCCSTIHEDVGKGLGEGYVGGGPKLVGMGQACGFGGIAKELRRFFKKCTGLLHIKAYHMMLGTMLLSRIIK